MDLNQKVALLKTLNFDTSKMRNYCTKDQYAEALAKGSANGRVTAFFYEIPYLKAFPRGSPLVYLMLYQPQIEDALSLRTSNQRDSEGKGKGKTVILIFFTSIKVYFT